MEILQKIKREGISDSQKEIINTHALRVSKDTFSEVCPKLLDIALESEKGLLKNELGAVIFHLQKNERLETLIGFQKLVEAGLIVAPEETLDILESQDKEYAEKIRQALK